MKVLRLSLFIVLLALTTRCNREPAPTSTYGLVEEFCKAWNAENLKGMESLLDPDAFFKSPYQLRYTRDTMLATVLSINPRIFKVIRINETHTEMRDNLAWSIGDMLSNVYDDEGKRQEDQFYSEYIFTFVRNRDDKWLLQMMIFHE